MSKPAPVTIVHFMRQGQVFLLREYFPSATSYETALENCFSDKQHQQMREQQENRNLEAQLETIKHNYPFDI